MARTGAPWRDLPKRFGPWQTVASRFYRWRAAGVWERVFAAVQQAADTEQQLDWSVHCVDGSVVRAHQHAAGAKKGDPHAEALGHSQGGFSTKIHARAEGQGKPITFVLTPGQRHEAPVLPRLLEQGKVKRPTVGRPRCRPRRLVGDKGYSARSNRALLRRRGIRITIPHKRNECRSGPFDRQAYRARNKIERMFNRLKQWRRIATRYEKRAVNYLAMLTIVATLLWV